MKIAEDIENSTYEAQLDETKAPETTEHSDRIRLDDPCLVEELEKYRAAVIESINAGNIRSIAQDVSKSCDSEVTEHMISVKMLDGENFVTEWGAIEPPPPPDHGLHSPIVETILSRWTDDRDTQRALLEWAESILNGSSPDEIPPLKIAGLDHQLKEGFIMHIFPLLLRRKDIHVQLTSRATRTTSYDVAVSISRSRDSTSASNGKPELLKSNSRENKHLMAFRATCNGSVKEKTDVPSTEHQQRPFPDIVRSGSNAGSSYTAITTPISNRTPTKPKFYSQTQSHVPNNVVASEGYAMNSSFPSEPHLPIMAGASPSLVDDLSVGSSMDEEDTGSCDQELRQSGIMNSIGGAFGLLSRKKAPMATPRPSHDQSLQNSASTPHSMYRTPQRHNADSSHEQDHPYHRLVSAPPGKIGLTFIEHRGHCMVSNVTNASPLAGYVHPSDILIAIDDIPVSGLRTREIVKLLTAKQGQRRDLRMISSHDMNELIRPGAT
jgi:hypothetical protein